MVPQRAVSVEQPCSLRLRAEANDHGGLEFKYMLPQTQAQFAARDFLIIHDSRENDKAIGTEENAFL